MSAVFCKNVHSKAAFLGGSFRSVCFCRVDTQNAQDAVPILYLPFGSTVNTVSK